MTQAVNIEAHTALRVAECLRVALAHDEFTPTERKNLTGLYADNVAKAAPALFPDASAEQIAVYAPYVRKVLDLMLEK
ncbi:MAG TPA: hypothetical protein VNZ85_15380 [Caulobacter sp.]|nr:hypothetical protein [Caulobacter sp.]